MANLTLEEKYDLIKREVVKCTHKDPIAIVRSVMRKDYIAIHGPEHHFLDGAAFLTALKNAGGTFELEKSLDELAKRTIKMPGAMFGKPIYEISFFFYMNVPNDFSPKCDSCTEDDSKEYLKWISLNDEQKIHPAFFKTELKKPINGIRHIITDER